MKTFSKMKTTQRKWPQQHYLKKFVDDSKTNLKLTQNGKCYQLSKPEIEFTMIKEMYAALGIHT